MCWRTHTYAHPNRLLDLAPIETGENPTQSLDRILVANREMCPTFIVRGPERRYQDCKCKDCVKVPSLEATVLCDLNRLSQEHNHE